ncbi:MAG: protein kinase [Deltaproteobacteria bacterium]|nr:protein kinase [Deltaproteobacteria bacterium]
MAEPATASRQCHRCGIEILDDARRCHSCGTALIRSHRPPALDDPLIGRIIDGKFEVRGVLGEGAMGRVYRARQVNLDKPVALKVLHKNLANDPLLVKRFHREARAASKLAHPNSLAVIDFGGDKEGTLYIAMELLEGEDLGTVLQREGTLPPERIVDILSQVCLALEEAHEAGIVHRDLKPENIFIQHVRGKAEFVKVCDFGIAKIAEEEGGASKVTMAGFVCGTPEYMSPEQARGDALDSRADLYSIGIILYEMLTGQVPFRAESALGVVTRHLTEQPKPPHEARPDAPIPAALERICMKAIAKKREDRFASAEQLRRALESALHDTAVAGRESAATEPVVPIPRTGVSPVVVIAAVVLLGASAVGAWWLATRRPTEITSPRPSAERPPAPTKTSTPSPPSGTDPFALVAPGAGGATDPTPSPTGTSADAGGAGALPIGEATPPTTPSPDPPATVPLTPEQRRAAEREERRQREEDERRRLERERLRQEREAQERQAGARPPTSPSGSPEPPPTTPTQSPGETALAEARQLRSRGQLGPAASRLEEAARLMPGNARVYQQLGQVYTRMGQVDRARAAYRRYLRLAPNARDAPAVRAILGEPAPAPPP